MVRGSLARGLGFRAWVLGASCGYDQRSDAVSDDSVFTVDISSKLAAQCHEAKL